MSVLAPCAPGTYYDEMTTNCTKCTLGMYQDEAGQIACKPCPNDTYTYSDGAASVDLCFGETIVRMKNKSAFMFLPRLSFVAVIIIVSAEL